MEPSKDRPPKKQAEQSVWGRISWFVIGLLYLGLTTIVLSKITLTPLALTIPIVAAATALLMAIIAALGVRLWRYRSKGWQFQISSVFLVTVYLSVFFACIRWVIAGYPLDRLAPILWVGGIVQSLFFFGVTSFILLRFTDSFVWLAVLAVRMPWVQHWLGDRRENEE